MTMIAMMRRIFALLAMIWMVRAKMAMMRMGLAILAMMRMISAMTASAMMTITLNFRIDKSDRDQRWTLQAEKGGFHLSNSLAKVPPECGLGPPSVSPDQESGPIVVWMAEIATAIGEQT